MTTADKVTKKLTGPVLITALLTIAPLLFTSYFIYYTVTHEATLAHFSAWQWALLTVICCLTSTIAVTLPTLLALVFGYFLGWQALVPLFALNMGAIFLVNLLARWIGTNTLLQYAQQNAKARNILEQIHRHELRFIFFAKLSPVLPFSLTNLVLALSGAQLKNILLGGFLGMVPRTILAVLTGSQAREIRTLLEHPNQANWVQITIIILLVASVAGLLSVFTRRASQP